MSSGSRTSLSSRYLIKCTKMRLVGSTIGSPFSYLLFVVFLLLQQVCMAVAGKIVINPETQHVPINSGEGVFFCRAKGSNANWFIDDLKYDSGNRTQNDFKFSEIVTSSSVENDHNMTLSIPAKLEFNQTRVICAAYSDQFQFSEAVFLIVMGGPAPPAPVIRTINSTSLILDWEAPFTWDDYPINQYTLSGYIGTNTSLTSQLIPSTQTSLPVTYTEGTTECQEIEFDLRANNGLAESRPGIVSGGFPISPRIESSSITEEITYNEQLEPTIQLSVELPRVCSFQELEYHVIVTRVDTGEMVAETNTARRLYRDGSTVMFRFNGERVLQAMYNTTAVFNALAENDVAITTPVQISKVFDTRPSIGIPDNSPNNFPTSNIIILGIIGGTFFILIILFLIIITLACVSIQRRKSQAQNPNLQNRPLPMVTNPIYEGAVYETLDLHLKGLFSNNSSLERPSPPATPTSSNAALILETPYAVTTLDPKCEVINSHAKVHQFPSNDIDSYTTMSSARNTNKATHPEPPKESNLNQDVRYAREPGPSASGTVSSDW